MVRFFRDEVYKHLNVCCSVALKTYSDILLFALVVDYQGHECLSSLFLLCCSANANATFSLFGLCLSDIIDVDMQQHQRRYNRLSCLLNAHKRCLDM